MSDVAHVAQELLVAASMLIGTFFMIVTGVGLIRFPDVFCRMHAAGKAGTIGISLLILAPTLFFLDREPFVSVRGVLAIVFQALTTPGATYLLAHACYVRRYPLHDRTQLDELKEWLPTVSDEEFGRE
ncbi:MAG TPA: monovalent cation/H(+) antiporter subunit G [Candidatus Binatia bacterium]|nr:monovalent cation/H(+) antiporter subunit G [Candidatus Binatia bacterium]